MTTKGKLVKIWFDDPDVDYENIWAADLGQGCYRIENIPFFIYGISRGDEVSASEDDKGFLRFKKLVKSSGNKTLRARSEEFIGNATRRRRVIAALKRLGCDVEEWRDRLLAIHIAPTTDLEAVKDYLTNDAKVSWEYGNPKWQPK